LVYFTYTVPELMCHSGETLAPPYKVNQVYLTTRIT